MNFFIFFLAILTAPSISSSISLPETTPNSLKECNKTVFILQNSQTGMKFYVDFNFDDTVNVTYDCSVGGTKEGNIILEDNAHPPETTFILIKNCKNISVNSEYPNNYEHEVMISDVKILKLNLISSDRRRPWEFLGSKIPSLILKNVGLDYIEFPDFEHIYVRKVKQIRGGQIQFNGKENAVIRIEDSHFNYLPIFKGKISQIYIINNTFEELTRYAVDQIEAKDSIIFLDNHFKRSNVIVKMKCPKVDIIGNTFNVLAAPLFDITLKDESYDDNIVKTLNMSLNTINKFSHELLILNNLSTPDAVIVRRNYFNCSLKNWFGLENLARPQSRTLIQELLIDNDNQNVCFNFGDCPLGKVLLERKKIASKTFVCRDDENESEISDISLFSVLRNLTEALQLLVNKQLGD